MQFIVTVYIDQALVDALPAGQFDAMMRDCIAHADHLREIGKLHDSAMLEPAPSSRTLRTRNGKQAVLDGPFAETKEMLGGYNIIEAASLDEAVRIASEFPWTETGCVEIRPIRDLAAVRQGVGAGDEPA